MTEAFRQQSKPSNSIEAVRQRRPNTDCFCWAPFRQMLLSPTGAIHPCCYHFGVRYGQSQDELAKIWNGKVIRKLRREFLNGEPRTCRSRIANLSCHKEFEHLADQAEISEVIRRPPTRLDLRLGGQCNLKCLMCDVWQQPNDRFDNSFLWSQGSQEIFPYLKEVEFAGGEPFIQKRVFQLIELIIATNPSVAFSFISNGHIPKFKPVLALLDRIQLKKIQVSLDAIDPKTYQQIRIGGHASVPRRTLEQLLDYRKSRDFELKVSFCILRQNWRDIPDMLQFCHEKRLQIEFQYAHYDPSSQASLNTLNSLELQGVLQEIASWELEDGDRTALRPITEAIQLTLLRRSKRNAATAMSNQS